MGAVGSGIEPGVLVKIIGTSTCDMTVSPKGKKLRNVPGICGSVPDSIIPGFIGMEAGQSAVGDIFYWFINKFLASREGSLHNKYASLASEMKPGQSGLLALDWHNGNRNVLVDPKLTGLILGFTLNTKPEEVYRALIEATGFGARIIIERMKEYGVEIKEIVATGGIPDKNPLLMQVYADITEMPLKIAASGQTCAVGAAVFGAIAAGKKKGGFEDVAEARRKICRFKKVVYKPDKKNRGVYDRIYRLYKEVHDAFGVRTANKNLYHIMKELLKIQNENS